MAPLCNVVDRCGGCPWLARDAEAERQFKITRARAMLDRLGAAHVELQFVDAPARSGYRNRIRLRVDEQGIVGFFNPDKSLDCAVLQPALREFVSHLCAWARAHAGALAGVAHLEARAPDADARAGLMLNFRADAQETNIEPLVALLTSELNPVLRASDRTPYVQQQRLAHYQGSYQYVPLNGFIQINPSVNLLLVAQMLQVAREHRCQTFVDLYGGAGNFALPLARAGLSGSLIEIHPQSVRAAERSAQEYGLAALEVHHADAMALAREYWARGAQFDLVVVDPPRAGIRDGLEIISALAARAIAYCSCNLVTLERDLRRLLDLGWQLRNLVGFDMFPGTEHQETLAVCARSGDSVHTAERDAQSNERWSSRMRLK